ncbi:MAG: hypothetical protein M1482_15780, partial [Chloroflexi bacterium]|nr:hypothetical protein [Chloroflexota bacterium]
MKLQSTRLVLAGAGAVVVFAVLAALALSATPPGSMPPVKQTLQASAAQTRAAASSRPQPPRGPTPVPQPASPAPIARRAAGAGYLVSDFSPPFPAMSHVITSMWYEESGGQRTIV